MFRISMSSFFQRLRFIVNQFLERRHEFVKQKCDSKSEDAWENEKEEFPFIDDQEEDMSWGVRIIPEFEGIGRKSDTIFFN